MEIGDMNTEVVECLVKLKGVAYSQNESEYYSDLSGGVNLVKLTGKS